MNSSLELTLISRGIYGYSGYMQIFEDVDDRSTISVDVYYSSSGSNMIRSPYNIAATPFMKFLKTYYKDLVMTNLLQCSENAPTEEDLLGDILTKRLITVDKCTISNENFPSYLRYGYYKIVITFGGPMATELIFILLVETD